MSVSNVKDFEMDDNNDSDIVSQTGKKGRHRKKQLYQTILSQLEFYFSDSNITKDRFLSQLIKDDPYVELSIFLKFNKIRQLTDNVKDVAKAVKTSTILKLSEDGTKIRRTTPIKQIENIEDCTIYVERIPTDVTHEGLSKIFSQFGNVLYVSIPKYKHNKMIKGFAFVEFATVEAAQNTLDHFAAIGCKLPSQMAPEKLYSIATFDPSEAKTDAKNCGKTDQSTNLDECVVPDDVNITPEPSTNLPVPVSVEPAEIQPSEIELNEQIDSSVVEVNKKRKIDVDETETVPKKPKLTEDPDNTTNDEADVQGVVEASDVELEQGEKKRRRRKKNIKKGIDIKELGLQVLSKREWKRLRNKYLDLQRTKMKNLKNQLYRARFTNPSYHANMQTAAAESSEVNTEETKSQKSFNLLPETIVHMQLPEPCIEIKSFKAELKSFSSDIKYVDVSEGQFEAYVRLGSAEAAKEFVECPFPATLRILDGEMQKEYFKKAEADREAKFADSANKVKRRGRDKLLKRAEKELGKHIRFEEAE